MTFYERYADLCAKKGLEPCSQKAADLFSTTRATISTWRKTKAIPRGETVKLIADALDVSTDYLLGRTNDSTDYASQGITPSSSQPIKSPPDSTHNQIMELYDQLDSIDQVRVESYIEGILTGDKYKKKKANRA